MQPKLLLFLFGIIAITELYGELTHNINIIYVTKPLLMVVLSIYYFFSTKKKSTGFTTMILLGILFSIGGDSFLMFDGSLYFMAGLGCFLITHVCYTVAFFSYKSTKSGFLTKKWWFIFPFVIYLITLLTYLWGDLSTMTIPVVIYSTIICIMAIAGLNLKNQLPKPVFNVLFTGILLFMFSDSIIALNKFKAADIAIPNPNLLIMITYITAQLFIAQSTIKANANQS